MKLHVKADPVSSLDLERLWEDHSGLLPVRVLAKRADADLLIQIDVIPKGNGGYSARWGDFDLLDKDHASCYHENVWLLLYSVNYINQPKKHTF